MNSALGKAKEDAELGSFNYVMAQANLTWLLRNLGTYTVCTELVMKLSPMFASIQNVI